MPQTQQQTQAPAWYQNGITQTFGQHGEQGVDLAEPFHTPITALYGGTVIAANYTDYGSDIKIAIPGTNWVEEYLHQDYLGVGVGQQVQAGQVIGLSGGETPAQALNLPGALHPASVGSTGPHVEFDLSQNGTYRDPRAIIQALQTGSMTVEPQSASMPLNIGSLAALQPATGGAPTSSVPTQNPVQIDTGTGGSILDPTTWLPSLEASASDLGIRLLIFGLAAILLIVGLLAFFFSGSGKTIVVEGAKGAAKAAGAAAVA